jgi:tRNA threonylcarbamoyladenosine biosynthesis protein TsaE
MQIALASVEEITMLGRVLSTLFAEISPLPVFFYGDLGMGKTTLINSLCSSLPGGEDAETSSPSFTLCNMYPTEPPVAHFDLYRQENGAADESLLNFLDGERHLVLVEWAERLPEYALPPTRLACEITAGKNERIVRFTPYGLDAERLLEILQTALRSHTVFFPRVFAGK